MTLDLERHAKLLSDEELIMICDYHTEEYESAALSIYQKELNGRGDVSAARAFVSRDVEREKQDDLYLPPPIRSDSRAEEDVKPDTAEHAKVLSDEDLVMICDKRAEDYEPAELSVYQSELESRGNVDVIRMQVARTIEQRALDNKRHERIEQVKYDKIGGFLTFFGIMLLAHLTANSGVLLMRLNDVYLADWSLPPLIAVWDVATYLAIIFGSLGVLVLLSKRDRRTPMYAILYLKVSIVVTIVDGIIAAVIDSNVLMYPILSLVLAGNVAWIIYFQTSDRVKKTFKVTSEDLSFSKYLDRRQSLQKETDDQFPPLA